MGREWVLDCRVENRKPAGLSGKESKKQNFFDYRYIQLTITSKEAFMRQR